MINRYCGDDYKRNAEVLERFKREAEEKKRIQKYKHLTGEGKREGDYYSNRVVGNGVYTEKNNLSLLPITNSSRAYNHHRSISSP